MFSVKKFICKREQVKRERGEREERERGEREERERGEREERREERGAGEEGGTQERRKDETRLTCDTEHRRL